MSVWVTLPAAILVQVGLPLGAIAIALRRRWGGWSVPLLGAGAFLVAQLVRQLFLILVAMPLQPLAGLGDEVLWPLNGLILALSAGLFEEGARYAFLKGFLPQVRDRRSGLLFGLGHGGVESVLIGLVNALNLTLLLLVRAGLALPQVQEGLEVLFAQPVLPLWSALERILAIGLHLCLTLWVVQAVRSGRRRWLIGAIGLHSLADFVTYAAFQGLGWPVARVEGGVAALTLGVALLTWAVVARALPPGPAGVPAEPEGGAQP